jgi:hypothetical protein
MWSEFSFVFNVRLSNSQVAGVIGTYGIAYLGYYT